MMSSFFLVSDLILIPCKLSLIFLSPFHALTENKMGYFSVCTLFFGFFLLVSPSIAFNLIFSENQGAWSSFHFSVGISKPRC